MKIANGLEMLELDVELHAPTVVHPTLLWDGSEQILFDTGAPGQSQVLIDAVKEAGIAYEQINKIFFTHHDGDHVGDIGKIVTEVSPSLQVIASEGEKAYIEGDLPPLKMTAERKAHFEKMLSELPEDKRKAMRQEFENTKAPVNQTVSDGDVIPLCGGIEVIETPGHTHGHTCYYLQKYKVLIAGDALNVINGDLVGPAAVHTFDMSQAIESLNKLLSYDIESIISYHGGLYQGPVRQRIQKIIAGS